MAVSEPSRFGILAISATGLSEAKSIHERVTASYEAHRDGIYRFLVAQGLSPEDAQEATQDVFVDLYVAMKKGREVRSERGWLYTVAGRAAVDYWRRERRPIWVALDANPGIALTIPSQQYTPDVQTAEKEQLRRIANGLRRLPKEQRLCVHLRMQGLRYREIAKILGVSISTAAELISSAVARLRGKADD